VDYYIMYNDYYINYYIAIIILRLSKKETKKSQYIAISETLIYNYIQNMSIYVHIAFFLL